jgi:hypothetical protein
MADPRKRNGKVDGDGRRCVRGCRGIRRKGQRGKSVEAVKD